nr:uncharacterized protein LOC101787076 [Cavia porcellus]
MSPKGQAPRSFQQAPPPPTSSQSSQARLPQPAELRDGGSGRSPPPFPQWGKRLGREGEKEGEEELGTHGVCGPIQRIIHGLERGRDKETKTQRHGESIPRRRHADRAGWGNQAQGGRWGEGDPSGPPRSPLHPPGLAPTWLSPGAVVPPSRAPSGGPTGFGRGAAASEPPRPRRPSPRPQSLTRRGRGIAPAPGGGAGIQSILGKRRARGWDVGEPENGEPRRGDGRARRGRGDKTELEIHWLRGLAARDQKAVQAEDPKGSGAEGAVHGNPQGLGAPGRRIRGAGAGIQPESSGRGRDLVDPEGGQEGESGESGEGRSRARTLEAEIGAAPRSGDGARRGFGEAQQPGGPDSRLRSPGARPPPVHPSPRVMIRPAEQPQQPPRVTARPPPPAPRRERRTPLARTRLPARRPSGASGDWRRWTGVGVDRRTDARSQPGPRGSVPRISHPRGSRVWGGRGKEPNPGPEHRTEGAGPRGREAVRGRGGACVRGTAPF